MMALITEQGSTAAAFWFWGRAMVCCDPSPKGQGHPRCPPQHHLPLPPLGCPSTRCPLQVEDTGIRDSNVTLAPGAWAWSGTVGGISSLPC